MVYNIQFQICGLVMVCMVLYFAFSHKTLQVATEKMYRILLIVVTVCLLLDMASIVAVNLQAKLNPFLVEWICKAYTISICTVAMITRVYILVSVTNRPVKRIHKLIIAAPVLMYSVLTLLLPIHYHIGNGQVYTHGLLVQLTYITVSIYVVLSSYYLIRGRKLISKENFAAITFLLLSFVVTAILQFMRNEWLLVGFAMAAAMVFMYCCLENPTEKLDSGTGMFNQMAFQIYVENLFSQEKDFSMIVFEVDDMSFITNTFGVINVNAFLQDIGEYLEVHFKGKVFRNLDNRFALILSDDLERADDVVGEIQKRFETPWKIADLEYSASICMIEMLASSCGLLAECIVEISRYFMNEAKKEGKGSYIKVSKKHLEEREENYYIEKALRNAIEKKQVQVHYQPIYSVKEEKYVSAEALTRIFDDRGGFIRPDLFIPIAEQNGMILELGMLIFEEVCRFINEKPLKEQGIHYIEINLSVVQCMQEKLADELIGMMKKYQIPPNFINLEITETAAANSDMILKRNMNKLIDKGVTFALDDYGTGYSNLLYVVDLPIKLIKLDKSLVQSYCDTKKAKIAMEFTILMIKKLGLKVVVEGIETAEQLEKMGELEVDFIQGFYFSKPLEKSEFWNELIRKNVIEES